MSADDYQLKSCILCQSTELLRKLSSEKGMRITPRKNEWQPISRVHYFALKERIPTYTRVGNIDSNNVKIFSMVDESFEIISITRFQFSSQLLQFTI